MFHYVEDKEFLRRVRGVCGELMQDFLPYAQGRV